MSSSGTGSRQWLSHVRVLVCSPSPQVWLHNDHALQSENSGEGPEIIQGKINHFLISYSQSLALQTLVSDKGPESFLQYAVHVRCRVWTPSSQVLLQVDQTLHNENSEGPKENLSRWESHRETISTWIIAERQGLTISFIANIGLDTILICCAWTYSSNTTSVSGLCSNSTAFTALRIFSPRRKHLNN